MWRYVYRAVDGYGQVIDVFVSSRRDVAAARKFSQSRSPLMANLKRSSPTAALANVIEQLLPHALHNTVKDAHNRVERWQQDLQP